MKPYRLARVLTALLALAAPFLTPLSVDAQVGGEGTTVTLVGNTIQVHTRIEISGSGATPEMAWQIQQQIDEVWQAPHNQHQYCGRAVLLTAEVRTGPGYGLGTPGWNHVDLVSFPPGSSFRSHAGEPGMWNTGDMDTSLGRHMVAHEVLHYFGGEDGYEELPPDFPPRPNREGSLAAEETDTVDVQSIDEIMQTWADALPSDARCEIWTGKAELHGSGTGGCGFLPATRVCSNGHFSVATTEETIRDIPTTENFHLYLDHAGNLLNGSTFFHLASHTTATFVIPPPVDCHTTLDWWGEAAFDGHAIPGPTPPVTLTGALSLHEDHSLTGNCPIGNLPSGNNTRGDNFILEGFDRRSGGGRCQLGTLDQIASLVSFTYECTYTAHQLVPGRDNP